MTSLISRVFMNGNSQAVRIPQEFRLETNRVQISRTREGDLLIRPVPAHRGTALLGALQAFDDDLAQDLVHRLVEDRNEQAPAQERDVL